MSQPPSPLPKNPATTTDRLLLATSVEAARRQERFVEAPAQADRLDRRDGASFLVYKLVLGLVTGFLGFLIYQGLGRADLHRSTALLDTAFDRAIPLLTWTTWFYQPLYVGIFVVGLIGFRSKFLYDRAIIGIWANVVVGALGHYFIRAEYPRPVLPIPYPDISTWFLAQVHRIDPPGNVFPSLHVAHTFMITFLLSLDRPRLGRVALVMSILLALSTMTTKQHFVADVVAGLAMAFMARAWANREVARLYRSPAPTR
jgi:membrane-associated phospholipid phosphatase